MTAIIIKADVDTSLLSDNYKKRLNDIMYDYTDRHITLDEALTDITEIMLGDLLTDE